MRCGCFMRNFSLCCVGCAELARRACVGILAAGVASLARQTAQVNAANYTTVRACEEDRGWYGRGKSRPYQGS
jgi:hypothetical protein